MSNLIEKDIVRKDTFQFKPKARIIKTIGEELISNDNVAIIELVKNSYDANSPIVDIVFKGNVKTVKEGKKEKKVIDKEGAEILIVDAGAGMDFKTVNNAWMEPATNYKKKNVNPKKKFAGEKGIGRFAAAKLASNLELITKKENNNEIVVNFNWHKFSDEEKYLSEIYINYEVRNPEKIKDKGTVLKLTNLINDWDVQKISELRIALSRLLNPIVPEEDFLVYLKVPDALDKNLSGLIERPATLEQPDYSIKGTITNKGRPSNIIFISNVTKKTENLTFIDTEFLLRDPVRKSVAGSFNFEFKIWNRDDLGELAQKVKSTIKNVKKDLDDLSGISIYRDNIRVLPYGNQNNDWVRLDIRRVNNPTLRLSNNQIVGYISIGMDSNPDLKDQSNREGIVEGQAFEDIKEFIKLILNEVEQRRYDERPRKKDKIIPTQTSLFENFSLEPITTLIQQNSPKETVIEAVEKKDSEIKEGVKKVQEVISKYRRLSTLGQLIDTVLHDGRNYLNKIDVNSRLLLKAIENNNFDKNEISLLAVNIQNIRKDFAALFRRLEPFSGKKRGRPKNVILEEIIKNQFLIAHTELSRLEIEYEISQTQHKVTLDETDIAGIFMNLIQNSIYWLESISSKRKIAVEIVQNGQILSVLFSDNGPGIKKENADKIFDPYFSTKADGIGLGLTIAGELVLEYDGELSLVDNGPLDGATFRIDFKI